MLFLPCMTGFTKGNLPKVVLFRVTAEDVIVNVERPINSSHKPILK